MPDDSVQTPEVDRKPMCDFARQVFSVWELLSHETALHADRACKYDGEPIVYDPREDVWTRRGLHQYGSHTGSCGRKLVLLRVTPGTPPEAKR